MSGTPYVRTVSHGLVIRLLKVCVWVGWCGVNKKSRVTQTGRAPRQDRLAIVKLPEFPIKTPPGYGELALTQIALPKVLLGCKVLVLAMLVGLPGVVVLPG
jgi:hypothetical protein